MRRGSYLARIARDSVENGPSLAPSRVLFRPTPPAPDGLSAQAHGIPPNEVTPVAPLARDHPATPTRDVPAKSEDAVPERASHAPMTPRLPLAPSGRAPVDEGRPATVRPEERRTPPAASGPAPEPDAPRAGPAKPVAMHLATVAPPPATARSPAPPPATPRDPAPPARVNRTPEAPPNPQHQPPNVPESIASRPHFPGTRDSERDSETSRTVLVPTPPVGRESFAQAPTGAEKRSGVRSDIRATVRIGSLEVRIVPPPPPPVAPPLPRQSPAARPLAALARGFRSFGLTQG